MEGCAEGMTREASKKILFILGNLAGGGAEKMTLGIVKSLGLSSRNCKLWVHKLEGGESYLRNTDLFFSSTREMLRFKMKQQVRKNVWSFLERLSYQFLGFLEFLRKIFFSVNCRFVSSPSFVLRRFEAFLSLSFCVRLQSVLKNEIPDVVVTVLPLSGGGGELLALKQMRRISKPFRWIVCVHNNIPKSIEARYGTRSAEALQLLKEIYDACDGVIACSEGVKKGLVKTLGIDCEKIVVVRNVQCDDFLSIENDENVSLSEYPSHFIMGAGRLERQKRFDLLIEAFALIAEKTESDLLILGEGSQRDELVRRVEELKLEDRVKFLGHCPDVRNYLKKANCFVLSSDFEGYPMILLEAISVNCPIVATDCEYGPSEILLEKSAGTLVPVGDVNAIASGILSILNMQRFSMKDENVLQGLVRNGEKEIQEVASGYEAFLLAKI